MTRPSSQLGHSLSSGADCDKNRRFCDTAVIYQLFRPIKNGYAIRGSATDKAASAARRSGRRSEHARDQHADQVGLDHALRAAVSGDRMTGSRHPGQRFGTAKCRSAAGSQVAGFPHLRIFRPSHSSIVDLPVPSNAGYSRPMMSAISRWPAIDWQLDQQKFRRCGKFVKPSC
jgi:hypothetical protein